VERRKKRTKNKDICVSVKGGYMNCTHYLKKDMKGKGGGEGGEKSGEINMVLFS